MQRLPARSAGLVLATAVLWAVGVVSAAFADGTAGATTTVPVSAPRISTTDPLNGGFLLVNNHGMLFHPQIGDIQEDVAYARWLGSGIVRVFATDNNGWQQWGGARVG